LDRGSPPTWCDEGRAKALADIWVEARDVPCGEPAGESGDGSHLRKRGAASWAPVQMLVERPARLRVEVVLEVGGQELDELDAPLILLIAGHELLPSM
jgi:hypothetical protein